MLRRRLNSRIYSQIWRISRQHLLDFIMVVFLEFLLYFSWNLVNHFEYIGTMEIPQYLNCIYKLNSIFNNRETIRIIIYFILYYFKGIQDGDVQFITKIIILFTFFNSGNFYTKFRSYDCETSNISIFIFLLYKSRYNYSQKKLKITTASKLTSLFFKNWSKMCLLIVLDLN